MTAKPNATGRDSPAGRVLGVASWTMLGWIALGYLSLVPAVEARVAAFDHTPPGHAVVIGLLSLVALTMVAAWVGAVWYAVADRRYRGARKAMLVSVLVWANFVGGMLYYFLHVVWQPAGGHWRGRSARL